jgi:hypothetical protein
MQTDDAQSHSFVVKVWVEDSPAGGARPRWRGHITHVPDEQRRYFERIEPLVEFIVGYLESMGVRFHWWSRMPVWPGWTRRKRLTRND